MDDSTSSSSSKAAIITDGATGVGRATALQLAGLGYDIAVVYSRSVTEAEETVQEVLAASRRLALAIKADVANDGEVRAMVAEVMKSFGRVDVLVNGAGTTEFVPFADLDAVTDETWDKLFRVNVVGAFHCIRAVRQAMLDSAGGGIVINVSSVAAQIAQGSSIPYACSKAALDNLTVSLARTLAPEIRVNAVAPGFITGRWLENGLGANYEGAKAAFEASLPLHRVCDPVDVADCIVSLITGSKLVTGQTLLVDSGMMIAGFQARIS